MRNLKCDIPKVFVSSVFSLVLVFSPMHVSAAAVAHDPFLEATLILQQQAFEKAYKQRKTMREKTIAAQAAVTTALMAVHNVESKALEYMQNASSVLSDLNQIKNIAEMAISIPVDMKKILKEIPNNPKGAAITAVVSKKFIQVGSDVISLSTLVQNVVNSTYSFSDKKDDSNKKHVNLLSSAERYAVLMDVQSQLRSIKRDLMLLRYYIGTLGWTDLWQGLDRKSYVAMISAKWEVNSIIRKWDKITKK